MNLSYKTWLAGTSAPKISLTVEYILRVVIDLFTQPAVLCVEKSFILSNSSILSAAFAAIKDRINQLYISVSRLKIKRHYQFLSSGQQPVISNRIIIFCS